ncbi:MAG: hypothetical protein VKK04_18655 [Synechococcales bacterium]|nr:hypothetical protein [Synechococcales bacterium]
MNVVISAILLKHLAVLIQDSFNGERLDRPHLRHFLSLRQPHLSSHRFSHAHQ